MVAAHSHNAARYGAFATDALELSKRGLSVVPVSPDGKSPIISGFTKRKFLPSEATINNWASKFTDAGLGIVTGKLSGLTVVDIDDDNLLAPMIERFGVTPIIVTTPSGGFHCYYRFANDSCGNLRKKERLPVDIKGEGGFVLAPPTARHGRFYTFERGSWDDLQELPAISPGGLDAHARPESLIQQHATPKGRRNDTLFGALLRQARKCDDFDSLLDVARTINDDCIPPLGDSEVVKTAESAWRYENGGRNWAGQSAHIVTTETLLDSLVTADARNGAHAYALYCKLQARHGARNARDETFAVSPAAMAYNVFSWPEDRFRKARNLLIRHGSLIPVHKGGSGPHDPSLFKFGPLH